MPGRPLAALAATLAMAAAASAAVPAPQPLGPEPPFSRGTENTVSWERVAGPVTGYEVRARDVATARVVTASVGAVQNAALVAGLEDGHRYTYSVRAFQGGCVLQPCPGGGVRVFSPAAQLGESTQDARPPQATMAVNGGAAFTNRLDVSLVLDATDPKPGAGVDAVFTWSRAQNVVCPSADTADAKDLPLKDELLPLFPVNPDTAFCPVPFARSVPYSLTPGPDGPRTVRAVVADGAGTNFPTPGLPSDGRGNVTGELTDTIVLDTAPPAVAVVIGSAPAVAGAPVTFDASGSRDAAGLGADSGVDAARVAWTFGDGATATGPQAQHAYPRAGTFTGGVVVTDVAGNAAELPFTVTVQTGGEAGGPQTVNGGRAVSRDRVAPRLTRLRVVVPGGGGARAAGLLLRSSERGRLTVRLFRRAAGGRLVAAGVRVRPLRAGAQTVSLGRLAPGPHRAVVTATDAAGNRSVPRIVAFTVPARAGSR